MRKRGPGGVEKELKLSALIVGAARNIPWYTEDTRGALGADSNTHTGCHCTHRAPLHGDQRLHLAQEVAVGTRVARDCDRGWALHKVHISHTSMCEQHRHTASKKHSYYGYPFSKERAFLA